MGGVVHIAYPLPDQVYLLHCGDMYPPTPATKLHHLFGKVRALPTRHQELAIAALADIVKDFYVEDDVSPFG
jgi:hypothetical protein